MKLWLDDARRAPSDEWVHVLTSKACIAELETFEVKHLSLDHDLGLVDAELIPCPGCGKPQPVDHRAYGLDRCLLCEKTNETCHCTEDDWCGCSEMVYHRDPEDTGYRVVLWMEEHGVWPEQISLHSENPAGVKRMRLGIMASGLYKAGPSGRQFHRKVEEPDPAEAEAA